MIRKDEVNFAEVLAMLDVPEEILGKLSEKGKLKLRIADGTIYFLREEIDALIDQQIEEVRASEGNAQSEGGNE